MHIEFFHKDGTVIQHTKTTHASKHHDHTRNPLQSMPHIKYITLLYTYTHITYDIIHTWSIGATGDTTQQPGQCFRGGNLPIRLNPFHLRRWEIWHYNFK